MEPRRPASIEVRLLGPFDVHGEAGQIRLAGLGERALLALLALSSSRPVAVATLIGQLWEDAPPKDPLNALHQRVSKLRRALSDGGAADCLVSQGSSYQLHAASVDVDAFTSLLGTARHTGDPQEAVGTYDQALALWRGEPLVDFGEMRWAEAEAARLDELRRAGVSERAERMLSLGRFEELVSDLEPVVRSDPLHERYAALLMTALFNAGRQADALAVFDHTRAALAEQLGIDPSRELRSTRDQILRQDTALVTDRAPEGIPTRERNRAPTNLPIRMTSFVGRRRLQKQVVGRLATARLVTLVGPGGAGKTSLAVEVARASATTWRDGAWLVRLAPVVDDDGVVHAVADGLGLNLAGGTVARRPLDVLTRLLAGRNLLLVLDNAEHVLDAAAHTAEAILSACPGVRVLVTSREALAIAGELQIPVPPLEVPDRSVAPAEVTEVGSVRLLLDRAAAVRAEPITDPAALAAVAEICRRLDGIPLALELSAARLTSMTPGELAARLHDRFGVLTSGSRTAEARQRTLRSTVDWSYALLTAEEQRLFRRLSVFRGGWSMPAAEYVWMDEQGGSAAEVFDLLDRLVRQSVVMAESARGRTRYRTLETLRQYAHEKLVDAGERDQASRRHADFFTTLAEEAETGLRGAEQRRWLELLGTERDNIAAALSWLASDGGDPAAAQQLAGSLGLYWHLGRHLEGRQALRRVLSLSGGTAESRARALQAVSLVERPRACIVHPSEECAAAARESLQLFEDAGDRSRASFSRLLLAVEGVGTPSRQAADLLDAADEEFRRLNDDWGMAVVSFVRMETVAKRGDEAKTRAAAVRAIDAFGRLDDDWGQSAVLYHYGWALGRFGRWSESAEVLERAIAVARSAGIYNTVQWASADRGVALLALGQVADAKASFADAGAFADQVGDHAGSALTSYGDAVLAHRDGRYADARTMYHRSLDGFQALGVRVATGLALAGLAGCDESLGDHEAARDHYRQLLEVADHDGDIGLLATALEGLARVDGGDPERTAELLGHAEHLRRTHDRPLSPDEVDQVGSTADAARAALGEIRYESATTRGAMTRPDVG